MMNSILFGNGYWANIVKEKIVGLTNLLLIVDSKTNIDSWESFDVNIVFVCSSTSSHYDIVKRCLDKDIKYIFCTKPFTGDYKKAKELFAIAKRKGINIFVDNLFLFREEIINVKLKNIQNIIFHWETSYKNNKENIFDSLLYHDLYLLLKWSRSRKWRIGFFDIYDDSLYLYMTNEHQTCYFEYNVCGRKNKWIAIDGCVVNLTFTKQDSLKECIINLLQGDIDFDLNKKVTLDTLKLLNNIKIKYDK
jgi:hypothetical protein